MKRGTLCFTELTFYYFSKCRSTLPWTAKLDTGGGVCDVLVGASVKMSSSASQPSTTTSCLAADSKQEKGGGAADRGRGNVCRGEGRRLQLLKRGGLRWRGRRQVGSEGWPAIVAERPNSVTGSVACALIQHK